MQMRIDIFKSDQPGLLYVEECTEIHSYRPAQNSTLTGQKPEYKAKYSEP